MISLFFGLPGVGKTTILASHAYKYTHSKKSPYKHVYSNIPLDIKGVTFIDNDCIGKFDISDGVLLIDEGTLFADSRDFKSFGADKVYYFMMHRHFNVNIEIFVQQWDALDRKIRCITDKVFYVYKPFFLSRWCSRYYRIPYGIIIPDGKSESQKLGEIIQGYCKPPFLVRLFAPRVWRPKWYRFFDSWEHRDLPSLPSRFECCTEDATKVSFFKKIKLKVGSVYGKIKEKAGRGKDKRLSTSALSGQYETHGDSGDYQAEFSGIVSGDMAQFYGDSGEHNGTGNASGEETRSHTFVLS